MKATTQSQVRLVFVVPDPIVDAPDPHSCDAAHALVKRSLETKDAPG
jgi:hypothetical protein